MNFLFLLVLALIGIGLLVAEHRFSHWRSLVGGLGVNILAATVMLVIQQVFESQWDLLPIIFGGIGAILLMLPFVILQHRRDRLEISTHEKNKLELEDRLRQTLADKEVVQQELAMIRTTLEDSAPSELTRSGLTLYARNYVEDFQRVTGRNFSKYVRDFVTNSPPGTTFRAAGIDWTELFGEGVSATSERYFRLLSNPKTSFRVILLDPRCEIGLEKRKSEFLLRINDEPRYVPNHPLRVYGKIVGSVKMMVDYHKRFPNQFQYRFVHELPTACWIMNGEQIIFYLYSRSHKGWDCPVFVAQKVSNGIYEFFSEYFDFLWENPQLTVGRSEWNSAQRELASLFGEFERLLEEGCSGELHQSCPTQL